MDKSKNNDTTNKKNRYSLNNIKISSWNIQSTNNRTGTSNFKEKDFMDLVKNRYILCLQETRQASKI